MSQDLSQPHFGVKNICVLNNLEYQNEKRLGFRETHCKNCMAFKFFNLTLKKFIVFNKPMSQDLSQMHFGVKNICAFNNLEYQKEKGLGFQKTNCKNCMAFKFLQFKFEKVYCFQQTHVTGFKPDAFWREKYLCF